MAYYTDNREHHEFVSPTTQARFDKILATAEVVTGTLHTIGHAVAQVATAVTEPAARRTRVNRTAKILRGLSDEQLSDIGVQRTEIDFGAHETADDRVGQRHI